MSQPQFLAPLRVYNPASTGAGPQLRLKPKQARQHQLASLTFFSHVSSDLIAPPIGGPRSSRDALAKIWRRKGLGLAQRLKSTGLTPNGSRELSGGKNSALVNCTQRAIFMKLPVGVGVETRVPQPSQLNRIPDSGRL
jgi:hypothetical protein